MTDDELFEDHIPHRVNLLLTFHDRFSGRSSARVRASGPAIKWDDKHEALPRDFFRCSKDISMLMVRFFWWEMGIKLKQGTSVLGPVDPKTKSSKALVFKVADVHSDPKGRANALINVLKAANRAVAHIDDIDVDHGFKNRSDHEALFDVIEWTRDLIQPHFYTPNSRDPKSGKALEDAMRLSNNTL